MNENILISITESGSRVVIRSINSIATSADKAALSVDNLKASLKFGPTTRSINTVTASLGVLRTELGSLNNAASHLTVLKNAIASLGASGTSLTNLVTALNKLNSSAANLTQFSRVMQQIATHSAVMDTVAVAIGRIGSALPILERFKLTLQSIVATAPQIQALAAALRGLGQLRGDIGGLANVVRQLQQELLRAAQQAAATQRIIQQMGGAGRQASGGIMDLRHSLAGMAAYMVVSHVREWLDAWQSAAGLFKIATENMEQMHIVQKKITDAAKETRQDFTATTELYARLQRASQDVGASQNEMIKFTKGVGTVLAIQHTSANQARGALIQLGQALGMQNIRAQEFRSMNENLYVVLQTVAKNMDGMGGSVNKLRQKMLSGKLASKEFFEAFLKGLPALQAAFEKTSRTISQGFSVLTTETIETLGHLDDAIGFSDKFSKMLILIGNNLEYIIPLIIGVGTALIGAFGPAAWAFILGGLRTFGLLLLANPMSAFAASLLAVASYVAIMSDEMKLGTSGMIEFNHQTISVEATMTDFLRVVGQDAKDSFADFGKFAGEAIDSVQQGITHLIYLVGVFESDFDAKMGIPDMGTGWEKFFKQIAFSLDLALAGVTMFALQVGAIFRLLVTDTADMFKTMWNSILSGFEWGADQIIKVANVLRTTFGKTELPFKGTLEPLKFDIDPNFSTKLFTTIRDTGDLAFQEMDTNGFFQGLESQTRRAQAAAEARRLRELQAEEDLNKKNKDTLTPTDDGKAARELEKLRKEYEKIQNMVDPIGAAMREQAEALGVVSMAAEKLGKSEAEVSAYAEAIKKHYYDAINPLEAMVRKNEESLDLLRQDPQVRERSKVLQEQINALKKAGLTDDQINLDILKAQNKEMEFQTKVNSAKQQIFAASRGKDQGVLAEQEAIRQSLNDPEAQISKSDVKRYEMEKNPDLFAGTQDAIDANIAAYNQMYMDIDFMRQNDIVSEQTAAQMKANVKRKEQKEVLGAVGQGMDNLATLTTSKNKDLARIGKAAAVASATIKGFEAVQNALATPLPWPIPQALAATAAVAAAANVAGIVNTPVGFMTGGEFTVGGRGGADSQMVAFRASPGERVAVQTPDQYRKGNPNQESGTKEVTPAQIKVVNVLDPSLVGDYMSTTQGEQLVMNVIEKNSSKVRNLTR